MKQKQAPFSLDSADEENYRKILTEWLQAIEQLGHGYQQVDLLLAVRYSPIFSSSQPVRLQLSPQIESDLKQLQREACVLLDELSAHIQGPDYSPTVPLTIGQLRQHTALLNDWNQRIQATLCLITPSYSANRCDLN
ncbi:hypothetical protein GO755_39620 [Spirosoma sp. HMF4905]|uniref:Uncharacterized protein n=1 Tax=Spirosoma arboris TaxID=2682092 RepID=A0A7K1SQW0_9BACT|nr:hypothetical protein [Spirosoma arboris]MVM36188.1 hypothetical protein [Spirosoma arboris]